jgi:5-methylcytosine-specific restriction endonuclease McrA
MPRLKTLGNRVGTQGNKLPITQPGSWRTDKATSGQRGYTYAWQKASKAYLREHPLCVMCARLRRVTAATLVDHIEPHRGDMELFWNRRNWQSLCTTCHSSVKKREEAGGVCSTPNPRISARIWCGTSVPRWGALKVRSF